MATGADESRPRHILLMVIKNISALDYSLPLLWKIRRADPRARVSVLYCVLSRRKILRRSSFYSRVLGDIGAAEYDFADFLQAPFSLATGLWRRLCGRSSWDSPAYKGFRGGLLRRSGRRAQRVLNWCEGFLAHRVDHARVLTTLDPDVILFDNRGRTEFVGREHFYEYFERTGKRIFLLPHAPHHTGTTAFTPFDERGEALPNYCEFWMPFLHDRTWEVVPQRREQFRRVGYPGLDAEWLAWLRGNGAAATGEPALSVGAGRPLRCLFIIRKFLRPGKKRPAGHDAYIFENEEFARYLRLVREAIAGCGREVELVLKPHPSNDYLSCRRELEASGIARWRITHESVYAEVPRCDLVISLYSTTLLIPAMAGIPVILLHSRIQDEIHQWAEMKELYAGLRYYLAEPERLPETMREVVKALDRGEAPVDADVRHLREFYPDGALHRCLERLGVGRS